MKQYKTSAYLKQTLDDQLKKKFRDFITARGKNKLTRKFALRKLREDIRKHLHPGPPRRDKHGKRLITVLSDLPYHKQRKIRRRLMLKGV